MRTLRVLPVAVAMLALAPAATAGAEEHDKAPASDYVVVYSAGAGDPSRETSDRERRDGFRASLRYRHAVEGFAAALTAAQADALRSDPEIALVVPDRRVQANVALAPGDSVPPGIRRLGAALEGAVRGAAGVRVAVLDTGVDLANTDLTAVAGRNCISAARTPTDDHGHGTHVAGTIGARNNGAGVTGVAPGTTIVAVKVLDSGGSGTWSQIICGIDWVASTRTDADPANDIAVANMSLGGDGDPLGRCPNPADPMHRAICAATAAGVMFVVSAGNDAVAFDTAASPKVPAAYPEVLTVAAMADTDGVPGGSGPTPTCRTGERDDRYASFTNAARTAAGAAHLIAAPGVCIRSTLRGGSYGSWSGTSMAAPHVAGAAALCIAEGAVAGPCAGLSPAQIVAHLRGDAAVDTLRGFVGDPLSVISRGTLGYAAWSAAPPPPPPASVLAPTSYVLSAGSVYSGRGALSRLNTNDATRVEVTSVSAGGSHSSEIQPQFVVPEALRAAPSRLSIEVDGNASSTSAALSVRVFNVTSGLWQTVDGPRTGVSADRLAGWTAATPGDYISAAGVVRLSVRATRSSSFRLRTDMARVTVTGT